MTRVLYVGNGFCPARCAAAELPKALHSAGVDVDIIVPRLDGILDGFPPVAERLVRLQASIDNQPCSMRLLEGKSEGNVRTFFVDAPVLNIKALSLLSDEGIRAAAAFAHAVAQWIIQSPSSYDIIHVDSLEAGMIVSMMRTIYRHEDKIRSARIVAFVKGIEDKGDIDMSWQSRIGYPDEVTSSASMEFYGKLSILKGIYLFADAIAFPSDCIRRKIEKNRGRDIGMEGVLFDKIDRIKTIALGIDADQNNPETDKKIEATFSASDFAGKDKCKAAFIQKYKLKKNKPVVAFIGRFNSESGIDLVNDILDDLMDRQVNLVVAGDGNDNYTKAVESWKNEFKGSVAVLAGRPDLATKHQILSAADIVLIPAKSENISRLHLVAMKYGAVVVARKQGCIANDLKNVRNIDKIDNADNGFSFANYDSDEFFDAVMDALDVYETPAFKNIRNQAASVNLSLSDSAKNCIDIYESVKA